MGHYTDAARVRLMMLAQSQQEKRRQEAQAPARRAAETTAKLSMYRPNIVGAVHRKFCCGDFRFSTG